MQQEERIVGVAVAVVDTQAVDTSAVAGVESLLVVVLGQHLIY
jgi:hypothetical protein